MKDTTTLVQQFLWAATEDPRFKARHVSVCATLVYFFMQAHYQQPFSINRRQVMQTAKIKGQATYHKVIRELQAWGYIRYEPSYHPVVGSRVSLVVQE